MPEFYTVDRNGSCTPGAIIEILPPRYAFAHHYVQNIETHDEIEQTARELFPNGLSPHGQRYLFERHNYIQNAIPVNPVIELLSELVRRAEFPDRPSRFTSLFGTESIDDARRFRNELGQPHHRILRLSCDQYFRADMRFLNPGASGASALNLARKYWRGEACQEPLWEVLLIPPITVIEQMEPAA